MPVSSCHRPRLVFFLLGTQLLRFFLRCKSQLYRSWVDKAMPAPCMFQLLFQAGHKRSPSQARSLRVLAEKLVTGVQGRGTSLSFGRKQRCGGLRARPPGTEAALVLAAAVAAEGSLGAEVENAVPGVQWFPSCDCVALWPSQSVHL